MVAHLPLSTSPAGRSSYPPSTTSSKASLRKKEQQHWSLHNMRTLDPTIDEDLLLCDFRELSQKAEQAHAMMEMLLSTQKKIHDDNVRQAAMWQEKLDTLENTKSAIGTQGILDSLTSLTSRLGSTNMSCSSRYPFTLNPSTSTSSAVETPSMQELRNPTTAADALRHRRTVSGADAAPETNTTIAERMEKAALKNDDAAMYDVQDVRES